MFLGVTLFIILVFIISGPMVGILLLPNKVENTALLTAVFIAGFLGGTFITIHYTKKNPIKVHLAGNNMIIYYIFNRIIVNIKQKKSVKRLAPFKGQSNWGVRYEVVANANGKDLVFTFHCQAINNLHGLIEEISNKSGLNITQ